MNNVFSFVQDKCPFCLKRNHGHIFLKDICCDSTAAGSLCNADLSSKVVQAENSSDQF